MAQQITLSIDNQEISVPEGTTILKAAETLGIKIPTLCYDNRMRPFTSCFICVVEVEHARNLVPACSTSVTSGMKVKTNSSAVLATRKTAIDLMLSDHYGDCVAPCVQECPAHADVQGYVAHIANGDYQAAVRLIKKQNPLPIICGRVCPHPCESQCRRSLVDEAVAIDPLKRFASEYELKHGHYLPPVGKESGKKVAIVGGGPAGLSCSYYLRQYGHEVHIFEAMEQLGGMTRYGIPRFRLPWDLLDGDINGIIDLGVKVHCQRQLGQDFTLEDLKTQGFDAILLAIGAHKSKPMGVDNENTPGVMGGVEFLRQIVLGEKIKKPQKVAVIGGGDVAMDCARVARRLDAEVTILYRRTQKEMPALQHEQDETIEEGIKFRFLTAPTSVLLNQEQKACGLQVITMELGEPDASGRRRPVPIKGSEEELPFDLIISAIGQETDLKFLEKESNKPQVTKWKTLVYDEKNMATPQEGIFAAGDCSFGPNTVIRAIAEGHIAADAIHLYLNGAKIEFRPQYALSKGRIEELNKEDFAPRYELKKRSYETTFNAEKRLANGGHAPINLGLDEAQSLAEASRCIECGCQARYNCKLRDLATELNGDEKKFKGTRRKYEIDNRHPLIRLEADKCITCGSCVRMCSEVRNIHALNFVKRGFATKIAPSFEDALTDTNCDACGMCIDVCPTGAIAENTNKKYGPWPSVKTITSCSACSNGCGLVVSSVEDKIIKCESIEQDSVNNGIICKEGRFAHQMLSPFSDPGNLKEAKKLVEKSKNMAILLSPELNVETIFAAYQLALKQKATLYYLEGQEKNSNKYPFCKLDGTTNVALMERLGAKSWDSSPAHDLILSLDVVVDEQMYNQSKVIIMSRFYQDQRAKIILKIADPLESEGAFLNKDGQLAILRTAILRPEYAAHHIIASLGELKNSNEIIQLRKELCQEISEFKALLNPGQERLLATTLPIKLKNLPPSGRSIKFEEYVKEKFAR